jgi:hypothetical protein
VRAIQVVCPACAALVGHRCINIGYADEPKNKSGMHESRARRAHYATLGERSARRARFSSERK